MARSYASRQSRGLEGLSCEAYVPTHFLLGRRLVTPCFDCSAQGLECGREAWELLYRPVEGRQGAQEAWQELQDAYRSVCHAAGPGRRKRLASQLLQLQQQAVQRQGRKQRPREGPEAKILKLLKGWRQ